MVASASTVVFLLLATPWSSIAELTNEVAQFTGYRTRARNVSFKEKEPTPSCQMLQVDGNTADLTRGQFQFDTKIKGHDHYFIRHSFKHLFSLLIPEIPEHFSVHPAVVSFNGESLSYRLSEDRIEGTQGNFFFGVKKTGDEKLVAFKIPLKDHIPDVKREITFYEKLKPCEGIVEVFGTGDITDGFTKSKDFVVLMEPMATDLEFLLGVCGGTFSMNTAIQLMRELLTTFRHMHFLKVVHRDIKPANLMAPMPRVEGEKTVSVKIIDFRSAQNYTLEHTDEPFTTDGNNWIGKIMTMSIFAHRSLKPHPRDDLQSLLFTIIWFFKGSLPWEQYCADILIAHYVISPRNYIHEVLVPTMEYLGDWKEEYLKEFVLENKDFKELVDYIMKMELTDYPDFDFLQLQVESIAIKRKLNSSVMDWITIANKSLRSRDVLSAAVLPLSPFEFKDPGFRYILEPFYANLYNNFKRFQPNLSFLEELSPLTLQRLKDTQKGTKSKILVSDNIPLSEIQSIGFEHFTEKSRVILEQLVRAASYVGFNYIFNKPEGTIQVGVVFLNVDGLWGMESLVKTAVEQEAAKVKYPGLTFREEYDEQEKNEGYETIDYNFIVLLEEPFGSIYVAFTTLREQFCKSLNHGEFREITYTYKFNPSTDPYNPPTVTYTFTLIKQAGLGNFVETVRLAAGNSEGDNWTWSVDEIPWKPQLTLTNSSKAVGLFEPTTQVINVAGNTFQILGINCLSLDPVNSKPLQAPEAMLVNRFLVAGNGNKNVRVKWRKYPSGNYDFMFTYDTLYAELAEDGGVVTGGNEGSQSDGTSGKYNRSALRQLANIEASQMTPTPNLEVRVQQGEGYILLKTTWSGDENNIESNIRATIDILKRSLTLLSPKQKSETVSFAYGYSIKRDRTVNGVVICQLYFYDVFKMLRKLPAQEKEGIILQKLLHIEAERALIEPEAYPDAVLSIELSHDQFCNLGAAHFSDLAIYLTKAKLYQVGFAMRHVGDKCQVAIAFRPFVSIQEHWLPRNHFIVKPLLLEQCRQFFKHNDLQFEGFEINQPVIGKGMEVLQFMTAVPNDKIATKDIPAIAFKQLDVERVRKLSGNRPLELYCTYQLSATIKMVIEFQFLFVVREAKRNLFDEICSKMKNISEFDEFTFSADFPAIQPDDIPMTGATVLYIDTMKDNWDDAVAEVVKQVRETGENTRSGQHVRIGWTRNPQNNCYTFWFTFDTYYTLINRYDKKVTDGAFPSGPKLRQLANDSARSMGRLDHKSIRIVPAELGAYMLQTTITDGTSVDDRILAATSVLTGKKVRKQVKDIKRYIVSYTFGYSVNSDSSVNAVRFYETELMKMLEYINLQRKDIGREEVILNEHCFSEESPKAKRVEFSYTAEVVRNPKRDVMYLDYIKTLLTNSVSAAHQIVVRRNLREIVVTSCDTSVNDQVAVTLSVLAPKENKIDYEELDGHSKINDNINNNSINNNNYNKYN